MTAQEGAKEIEQKYIAHGLRTYENRPSNDPIDAVKNGRVISIKTHNENSNSKNIPLAGIKGVLENMRKPKYEHHIMPYDHSDGKKKRVTGLTVIDFSGLMTAFFTNEILNDIDELLDCVKSHNGKNGVLFDEEASETYSEWISSINEKICIHMNYQDPVFGLTRSFNLEKRTFQIQCQLYSLDRFLTKFPEKLLYRGFESECGFDVRQIIVSAKRRVTKRATSSM
jgi:hypothetical protein